MSGEVTWKFTLKRTHDGPGGWELHEFTTDDYSAKTCYTRNVDGSLSVALNAAGEAYFGEWADDVNTEIAAAMSAANASAESANGNEFCNDQCPGAAGAGSHDNGGTTSADTVSASVNWTTQSYDVGDPICDPDSTASGPVSPHIQIVASASLPGVDVTGFLNGINTALLTTSNYPGIPDSSPLVELAGIIDTLKSGNCVATVTSESPPNASYSFGGYELQIQYSVPTGNTTVTMFRPGSAAYTAIFTGSGSWSSFGTVSYSGPSFEELNVPGSGTYAASSYIFSANPSLVNSEANVRTIDETIPLEPSGDSFVPGADSAHVTGSGSATVTLTDEHTVVVTPHSKCNYDYVRVNRRPMQRLCGTNNFQLKVDAETGFKHPPGKFPPCEMQVNPVPPTT